MNYPLSDKWILWYHDIKDNNWLEDSYKKLYKITSLEDYWKVINTLKTPIAGMFFIMRENVFPRWEDINNIDGGYWTFRISKKDSEYIWNKLFALLIGNTLTKNIDDIDEINGISISPKINNCIIKIWNKNFKKSDILLNNIKGLELAGALYKKHQDQIKNIS